MNACRQLQLATGNGERDYTLDMSSPITRFPVRFARSWPRRSRQSSTWRSYTSERNLPVSVQEWISGISTAPARTSLDLIDLSRAQALHLTLPTRAEELQLPELGDVLGNGWTLCFHWDKTFTQDLGEDGTSKSFNAPSPYTRRMWASGTFSFPPSVRPLCIGDRTIETTRIAKVEYKPNKDLVFVHQIRTYAREGKEDEVLIRERRVHVFRRAVDPSATVPPTEPLKPTSVSLPSTTSSSTTPDFSFAYTPTASHLFRFSALTFNGHKIHYDPIWTRDVEGHPFGIVVHGPLTALTMLECASRWAQQTGEEVEEFDYRAVSPMYAGKEITFYGKSLPADGPDDRQGRQLEIWAEQTGKVGMRGIASLRHAISE